MFQTMILFFTLHVVVQTQVTRGTSSDIKDYALPYIPSVNSVCRDQQLQYYNKNTRMCCSKCPPGHHVIQTCHSTADTVCQPCDAGAYTELWNFMRQCHHCDGPCRGDIGFIETQACNASHNRICSCSPNKYCASDTTHGCLICVDRTLCPKGSGVSKAGTQNSDSECSPCPSGTFSDEESHSALCKPHRNCRSVLVAGDHTHDTICTDPEGDIFPKHILPPVTEINPDEFTELLSTLDYSQKLTEAENVSKVVVKNIGVPLGVICGGVLFAMVGLAGIAFVFASVKTRRCCSSLSAEAMHPNTAGEKQLDQRQDISFSSSYGNQGQEQEHLLLPPGSRRCSLEHPLASAGINGIPQEDGKVPVRQKKSRTNEGRTSQEELGLKSCSSAGHSCSDCAQVNVTCVVNVCKSEHASWKAPSAAEGPLPHIKMNENIPLSKEEDNLHTKPQAQISLDVEGTSMYQKGKAIPLSVEDTGMKISQS